ncbi:MAG: SufS family cysteine desulfurase [Bdellovibrionales bacterium]|nr:SufS family cysteine desulfurase [Bdellovibrionales bacterium]
MIDNIRAQFPQLTVKMNDKPLVYLDNAATTLKAEKVIKRLSDFYLLESANVHRGAHKLSDRATTNYEQARTTVQNFINAKSAEEIVFTRGTTEALNLLAHCLKERLHPGDKILLSDMEHHSNIVPWQLVAQQIKNIKIEYIAVTDSGELDLEDLSRKLDSSVKILSFTACSNVLGTLNPVAEICALAKTHNVTTIVDAAQWVAARPTDVQKWDCDFLCFSGHKIFAPFGIGVLYGKRELLNSLPPYQGGGSMIDQVYEQHSSFLTAPFRFEAGTPNVGGAIALAEALKYVLDIGFDYIHQRESELIDKTLKALSDIREVEVLTNPKHRSNIISFTMRGIHHSDIGTLLDQQGIAIRAGHHCCQLLMKRFGVTGTARVAFSIYNSDDDYEAFVNGIKKIREFI